MVVLFLTDCLDQEGAVSEKYGIECDLIVRCEA